MKKLNILGDIVAVKIRKIPDELDLDGRSEKGLIEVDPRAADPYQTFAHEYYHQVFDRIGVYRTTMDKNFEHILIDALATAQRDNIVKLYQAYLKLKKLSDQ